MFTATDYQSLYFNINIEEMEAAHSGWIELRAGLYLKPLLLNLVDNTTIFYSLAKHDLDGAWHYHTGTSHGVLLRGALKVCERPTGSVQTIGAGGFNFSPAGIIQKTEQTCDQEGIWLAYGVLNGNLIYLDDQDKPIKSFDAFAALQMIQEHCEKNHIALSELDVKIIKLGE